MRTAGRLTRELFGFFDEVGSTPTGYNLAQVLGWPDREWEDRHDFIQWAFPTDEPSRFNANAPVLDGASAATFRSDASRREKVRRLFDRWLAFCGVARSGERLEFRAANPDVWDGPNHNWLRITRVLRSLNLLGLPEEAKRFFTLLQSIRGRVDATTWSYWERAAGADGPA